MNPWIKELEELRLALDLKRWLRGASLISIGLLLCACDSKPLTEAECQTLTRMEIDFATDGAGEDGDSMGRFLANAAEAGTARCVAGKTYNRSDYKCMLRASSRADKDKCLSAVSARIRKP